MNKTPCSICGAYCSGKMEELLYTKEYPVCESCFNDHLNTPMKQLKKLIRRKAI